MTSTEARCAIFSRARHAAARVAPVRGSWQAPYREPRGAPPAIARPQRRGSPGPIPNPAVKPAFAESTAARGCGRAGRRAPREGAFLCACVLGAARAMRRERPAGRSPAGLRVLQGSRLRWRRCAQRRRARAAGPGRGSRAGPEGALRAVPLAGPISVLGR